MKRRSRSSRSKRGFTLIELVIGLTLFTALGYVVMLTLGAGRSSNAVVERVVTEDQMLREASAALIDDLRSTNAAHLSINVEADGNDSVRLQAEIEAAGAATWGVHERELGPTAAEQDRAGWFVRYIVVAGANGRELVREVFDDSGALQRSRVLARGLRSGAGASRGFGLVQSGAVWEVTLSTVGGGTGEPGMVVVFHARSRNE